MAGYSATPLVKNIGIKPGARIFITDATKDYRRYDIQKMIWAVNPEYQQPSERGRCMDNSERILRELRWIKWLNGIIVVGFAVTAGAFSWASAQVATAVSSKAEMAGSFSDQASLLLEQGKPAQVVALAKERERTHPMDPYVYWLRGKAYYQLGRHQDALKDLQRAGEIAPDWRDSYTRPYIKGIQQEMEKKK